MRHLKLMITSLSNSKRGFDTRILMSLRLVTVYLDGMMKEIKSRADETGVNWEDLENELRLFYL